MQPKHVEQSSCDEQKRQADQAVRDRESERKEKSKQKGNETRARARARAKARQEPQEEQQVPVASGITSDTTPMEVVDKSIFQGIVSFKHCARLAAQV